MYHNPVIKGFNPDPSVCKANDRFYLVTSTFEYFPGVPIYESTDLTNWKYIDSALKTVETARLEKCKNSIGGHYAATIRYHEGTFYIICTNKKLNDNFLVYSDSIHGPWKGPIEIREGGIDPSIFFDDDNSCFYTSNGVVNGERGILGFYIDPKTGERLSEERLITRGVSGHATEAPHVYKKDGIFYLIFAEGGTGMGHHEEVMRAKSLEGPWETRENNILSHVNRKDFIIQATGHADLLEYEKGKWCAYFLGIRKLYKAGLHVLGRETFLAPVEWIDGWPVIGNNGRVEMDMEGFSENSQDERLILDFKKSLEDQPILKVRMPNEENYILNSKKGTLTLQAKDRLNTDLGEPTMILVRQTEPYQSFKAKLSLESLKGNGGIGVWETNDYYYRVKVWITRNGNIKIASRLNVHGFESTLKEITLKERKDSLELEVRAEGEKYEFFADGHSLGKASYAGMATEALMYSTFTGALFFIYSEDGSSEFIDKAVRE